MTEHVADAAAPGAAPERGPAGAPLRTRLARVALSRLAEAGNRDLAALVDRHGPEEVLTRVGERSRTDPWVRVLRARLGTADPWARASDDLARTERLGGRVVVPEDPEWPTQQLAPLALLADAVGRHWAPPLCLWLRGPARLAASSRRAVAVVGARAATAYGAHVAGELGHGLADREWTVVSGGAYGIDGAAHRGALGAGGVTIAALAGGIDAAYPVGHTALFDRIADSGLLLTEYAPGESPQKHRFLLRNRLIAALCAGVVVVEAGARSGASSTADRAHQLGRVVMAVPGPVTSAMSVGTHTLLRDGCATLVGSAAHVVEAVGRIGEGLDDIGSHGAGTDTSPGGRPSLDPALERVLEAVPAGAAAAVEAIALAARTTSVAVRRALPTLVLRGLVEERAGTYRLSAAARRDSGGRSTAAD